MVDLGDIMVLAGEPEDRDDGPLGGVEPLGEVDGGVRLGERVERSQHQPGLLTGDHDPCGWMRELLEVAANGLVSPEPLRVPGQGRYQRRPVDGAPLRHGAVDITGLEREEVAEGAARVLGVEIRGARLLAWHATAYR